MTLSESDNASSEGTKLSVKKILLAVDKSGYKEKVINFAITLAKGLGAEVTAIHVIDKAAMGIAGDLLGFYRGGKKEAYEEAYEDVLKKQAEKLLAEAEFLGKKEGIKVETEVLMHSPSVSEEIIDYA